MNEEFSPGDLVCLKSGSPPMTVKDIRYGRDILCQWFSGGKLRQGAFVPESLQLAPTEDAD